MKINFLELILLQNRLNVNTNGPLWTSGTTNNGRRINWFRCIYMEAAEAMDSMNWKHWKNIDGVEDIDNVKVEIVDILHFILSQMIVDYGIESAAVNLSESYDNYIKYKTNFDFSTISKSTQIINSLDSIIHCAANNILPLSEFFKVIDLIDDFSMQHVRTLYIGKNCLNEFRQSHGYKEGNYIKTWNGKEDNVYMQSFLNEDPSMEFETLYSKLEEIYPGN